VVRNRLRRQVRGHLSRRQGSDAALVPGAYLVAIAPGAAETSPEAMPGDLDRCVERVTGARR
jgi:RNase P protein component